MTPREAIARQLWLKGRHFRREAEWAANFAWHEAEIEKPNRGQAADSAIGECVAQAERILRLLEAAGLEVKEK